MTTISVSFRADHGERELQGCLGPRPHVRLGLFDVGREIRAAGDKVRRHDHLPTGERRRNDAPDERHRAKVQVLRGILRPTGAAVRGKGFLAPPRQQQSAIVIDYSSDWDQIRNELAQIVKGLINGFIQPEKHGLLPRA